MQTILTPDQMRALEQAAFSQGVSSLLLMEDAARAAHAAMAEALGGVSGKDILYLVGQGHNGGDGLAMARLCLRDGGRPRVLLLGEPRTPDARTNYAYCEVLGISMARWDPADRRLTRADAVVDALFGIGFHGSLPADAAALAALVNSWEVPMFAVDIPSGMDSLTGQVPGAAIQATRTLAIGFMKTGHCLGDSLDLLGEIRVLPIAIPARAHQALSDQMTLSALEPSDLSKRLPKRSRNAHKGSNGRVLMYMGSMGMTGAAGMAAMAALRAGAGLLTIACEAEIIPVLHAVVPNAMCIPIEKALLQPPNYDVFATGCGLGKSDRVWQNILSLWNPEKPSVWDADALNLLATRPMKLGQKAVITPHRLEAARLLGGNGRDMATDPLDIAQRLQELTGATVILKSAVSVIRDDRQVSLNIVGTPALAKGGSGDALAGIVAGLMAQQPGQPPYESARTAALWLGMAGLMAEQEQGTRSVLTTDVIGMMGAAVRTGKLV